jgi:hypothetical protein
MRARAVRNAAPRSADTVGSLVEQCGQSGAFRREQGPHGEHLGSIAHEPAGIGHILEVNSGRLPGPVTVVPDVPHAFARVVSETAPRTLASSGSELARRCYRGCYRALRDEPLDWPAIDVFFGDERIVPIDHPDSNEGTARRALLDRVEPRTIHSMVALGADAYEVLWLGDAAALGE